MTIEKLNSTIEKLALESEKSADQPAGTNRATYLRQLINFPDKDKFVLSLKNGPEVALINDYIKDNSLEYEVKQLGTVLAYYKKQDELPWGE